MNIKMKHRVSLLVLVVAVMIVTFTICAFASTQVEMSVEAYLNSTDTPLGESGLVKINDEIIVNVDLTNNPGIIGMKAVLTYDPAVLELKEINSYMDFGGRSGAPTGSSGRIIHGYNGMSYGWASVNDTGRFISITFKVIASGNVPNSSINFEVDRTNLLGADGIKYQTINETIAVNTHNDCTPYLDDKGAEPATCLEDGLKAGKYCTVCKTDYREVDVAPGSHAWNEGEVILQPTCTEKGKTKYTCTREICGETEIREDIEVLEHVPYIETQPKEPTCTEPGYSQAVRCDVCKKLLSSSEPQPKLGHDYTGVEFTIDVKPTCTTVGSMSKHCIRYDECGHKSEVTEIDALGHTWDAGIVTKNPTCTENGETKFTCTVVTCGQTKLEPILALGHDYTGVEFTTDVKPTCTALGSKSKHCVRYDECGQKSEVTEIEVLGHTVVVDAKVEPTYTATGLTEGSHCSVCNTTLVAQNEIAKLFPWVWVIVGISVVAVGAVVVVYFTVIKKKNYKDDMFDDDDEDED